jgi:hypothetical protein
MDNVKKAGLPGHRWVATIEASRFVEGRAYVCYDAHRSDDDNPYVFVTEDFGQSWKLIATNLPSGSTRCCREDIVNQNVLYCGTEFGAYASANRGASWTRINNTLPNVSLPTVAVHEFAQHPITGELVAATHGRSIWICDVSALRQLSAESIKAPAKLYAPTAATRFRIEANRSMFSGADRKFVGTNPFNGATIYYSLAQKADKVELKVFDYAGQLVRQLQTSTETGMYRTTWELTRAPSLRPGGGGGRGRGGAGGGQQPPAGGGGQPPAAGEGGGGGGRPGGFGQFGQAVPPGSYRVVLTVDGKEFSTLLQVVADPNASAGNAVVNNEEDGNE